MFSGFQSNAFQSNAFQIVRGSAPAPTQGGGKPDNGVWRKAYNEAMAKYQDKARQIQVEQVHNDDALERAERRLAKIEAKRQEALADAKLQKQWIDAVKEIHALEIARQNLINQLFLWQDEDDISVLFLSLA